MVDPRCLVLGRRIFLRPIEEADIDRGWLEWINSEEKTQHLDSQTGQSREDLIAFMKAPKADLLAVCDRTTGTYLGNGRLSVIDPIHRSATYGRLLGHPEALGKGLGTELLFLLLHRGFKGHGLNRLYTGVIESNLASIKSNERVGMMREGRQRQARLTESGYKDVINFSMLSEDYSIVLESKGPEYLDPQELTA